MNGPRFHTPTASAFLPTDTIWRLAFFGFTAVAILLRLDHYLGARSLWLDEMFLVRNLLDRSFIELMSPLDQTQVAPLGFLWVEKAMVMLLGPGELALRLFPLIAGIAAVFLIYSVALRIAGERVALIALGLFSISEFAIYYSAEVKQYSSDIAVTLLVSLAVLRYLHVSDWRGVAWLMTAGAVGVWFSHPSSFALAGVGITLGGWYLIHSNYRALLVLGSVGVVWLLSFVASFLITGSAESPVVSEMREEIWVRAFAPPPTSLDNLKWYVEAFLDLFRHKPGGFHLAGIAAFGFIAGGLALWRQNRLWLFLLTMPILVTLAVSAATLYPFTGRLLMFLLPLLIIVIACGVEYLRQLLWPQNTAVWGSILALLVLFPLMNVVGEVPRERPYERENMKSVLAFIEADDEPYDALYIYAAAELAFDYYASRYDLGAVDLIHGTERPGDWHTFAARIDELLARDRVWLVFSHVTDPPARDYLLHRMDSAGRRLRALQTDGASAYLYDLRPGLSADAERSGSDDEKPGVSVSGS